MKNMDNRDWETWETHSEYGQTMEDRALGKAPLMEQIKQLVPLFKSVYKPGMSVLDIGCGVGHFFPALNKFGKIDYLGIDVTKSYIERAKRIFKDVKNAKFQVGDIFDLKLNKEFDTVICYMVLPFIPDYKKALDELSKVTKKDLFIRLLLSPGHTYIIKRYLDEKKFNYYNIYYEKEFVEYLNKIGFEDVKVYDDEFNLKMNKVDEWSTYTLGNMQISGNLILTWKVVHASKK
jgi:ubiquinone/menaquinone biosynthesis C-methylase UbiE